MQISSGCLSPGLTTANSEVGGDKSFEYPVQMIE